MIPCVFALHHDKKTIIDASFHDLTLSVGDCVVKNNSVYKIAQKAFDVDSHCYLFLVDDITDRGRNV